jgi:Mrp family chromosome partitioning ATPase
VAEPSIVGDLPKNESLTKAFSELRANTLIALGDQQHALVAVTSPTQPEPRRHVAAHLATAISRTGRRVLLVDGDTDGEHQPGQHHDWIEPTAHVVSDSLSVVTSQAVTVNDSTLLSSQASVAKLRAHAAQYDILILAAPPVLNVADTRALTSVADGTLLVVAHGKSNREDSVRASEILRRTNANLLGAVVVKN